MSGRLTPPRTWLDQFEGVQSCRWTDSGMLLCDRDAPLPCPVCEENACECTEEEYEEGYYRLFRRNDEKV